MAHAVKNLPAVQETRVQSLGWEDPLKEGVATHCSILVWRILWTEKPGRGCGDTKGESLMGRCFMMTELPGR